MTPQEKAKELFNKFCAILLHSNMAPGQKEYAETLRGYDILGKLISDSVLHINEQAKKCAVFHTEEMIANEPGIRQILLIDEEEFEWVEYWTKVKEEIEKI